MPISRRVAVATSGHVEKYASPVPRAWEFFAIFDGYFIVTFGKNKSFKNHLFQVISRRRGRGRCGRKERNPLGTSLCGLEEPNSPNCPNFQVFFFTMLAARAMGWQNPSPISPQNGCLLAEVCLASSSFHKTFFFNPICFFSY